MKRPGRALKNLRSRITTLNSPFGRARLRWQAVRRTAASTRRWVLDLDNARGAADLLFKMVGIVAALFAMSLFQNRPHLDWTGGGSWYINPRPVEAYFQANERTVPDWLENKFYRPNLPFTQAEVFRRVMISCEYSRVLEDPILIQVARLLRGGGTYNFGVRPFYLFEPGVPDDLTSCEELLFISNAILAGASHAVLVRLNNPGNDPVRAISISTTGRFHLADQLAARKGSLAELGPGESTVVQFASESGAYPAIPELDLLPDISDKFEVDWDRSLAVDATWLYLTLVGVSLFLVILVVRKASQPTPEETSRP